MIVRALLFLCICMLAGFAPVWILGLCAFAYALRYTAYELVVLAACIDAYYGTVLSLPYYTLAATTALFIVEYVKPRLIVYNETK